MIPRDDDTRAALPLLCALFLFIGTFLLYTSTINFGFAYDDVHGLPRAANYSTLGHARWLTEWTFDLQAGMSAGAYHWGNLAIHLFNGALLLTLLATAQNAQAIPVALLATTIFLLHPLQVESVAYVSARADLLVVTGFLISVWGLVLASRWGLVFVVVGIVVLNGAKPAGAAALLPLWAVAWFNYRQTPARAGIVLGALAVGVFSALVLSSGEWGGWTRLGWAAVQAYSVGWYLFLVALPVPQLITADPAPWLVTPTIAIEIWCVVAVVLIATLVRARAWGAVMVVAWVVLSVGWRVVLPHSETFGGPGDGYLLMTGLSVGIAAGIRAAIWSPEREWERG